MRFELDNPHHKLSPGSTATVVIQVPPERWALLAGMTSLNDTQNERLKQGELLAVPQSSVIDTGSQKIVYREVEPSVFDGVLVELGPKMMGADGVTYYPVLSGLDAGMKIVTTGSFLVDAETRLNPAAGSIYFGGSGGAGGSRNSMTTVRPTTPEDPDAKLAASFAALAPEDSVAAMSQRFCPVLETSRLGSMGPPVKLIIDGQPVFLCCEGCEKSALQDPQATVAKVKSLTGNAHD